MPHLLIHPTVAGYYVYGLQLVESVNSELETSLKDSSICDFGFCGSPIASTPQIPRDDYVYILRSYARSAPPEGDRTRI